jgi:hypothetical protein
VKTRFGKFIAAHMLTFVSVSLSACSVAQHTGKIDPMVIQQQGSFAVGGTVLNNPGTFDPVKMSPEGQTLHGDHLYTFYQIPTNARKFPLVMWHGYGQSAKTWETTPDGREGFQDIFLHGGDATVVHLPKMGMHGNTHFPFSDLSNLEIADLMSDWLAKKGLN